MVDVWANWWDKGLFNRYPPLGALYDRLGLQARKSLTSNDYIAEAHAGGVDRVLLSATAFPGSPATNDRVHQVVSAHPGVFSGCASVDPRGGMAALRELRRAVNELGCVAVKLLPFLYGLPPNHAVYFPIYAACIDLGIPVLILTGHTAVALSNETGRPGALDDVALHFPELTIIAGHAGYPWTGELVALAWKHQNLYIDTSGHRPRHLPPELLRFLNSYGRKKVLFGTGYPLMDYASPLAEAAALNLKPGVLDDYLGGNAARIWPAFAEASSEMKA